jgi:hypothetical protein
VAKAPTVHIIASHETRNGKTLLSRTIADYLLLDNHDPFLIDTDTPAGDLRNYFPGRTQLADFANVQGQIKIFDTILGSVGRDYVIDLTARHTDGFFRSMKELDYVAEIHKLGFRYYLFYIVDTAAMSLRRARELRESCGADLFIPVRNEFVGSIWPATEEALTMPQLPTDVLHVIQDRRFSLRSFVLGDRQGLGDAACFDLNRFVFEVLQGLNNVETTYTLKQLR